MRNVPHYNQYLFEQFRRGNKYARGYYYTLFVDDVFGYAQELTGNRLIAEAHTEKSFVKAFVQREAIFSADHLRVFLFLTVKQLSLEYLEETGRVIKLKGESSGFAGARRSAVEISAAELVWGEMAMALRTSWLHLPARIRRIVVLYYFRKLSTTEIAKKLEIDIKTVQQHLSQSVIFLRKGRDGRWEEVNQCFS